MQHPSRPAFFLSATRLLPFIVSDSRQAIDRLINWRVTVIRRFEDSFRFTHSSSTRRSPLSRHQGDCVAHLSLSFLQTDCLVARRDSRLPAFLIRVSSPVAD